MTPASPDASPRVLSGAEYVVKQGDCMRSIACEAGFLWETIWNHPRNASLKELRRDPNVLCPGDHVFIPERRPASFACRTGAVHKFIVKGTVERFRIALLTSAGKPRSGLAYELEIDGKTVSGTTNDQGVAECTMRPDARHGTLVLRDGNKEEHFELLLGHLDPVSEMTGVQARLNNLGFKCGAMDGKLGPKTRRAIEAFQAKHEVEHKLSITGEPDDATRKALLLVHGF